jgi:hypothetical protein
MLPLIAVSMQCEAALCAGNCCFTAVQRLSACSLQAICACGRLVLTAILGRRCPILRLHCFASAIIGMQTWGWVDSGVGASLCCAVLCGQLVRGKEQALCTLCRQEAEWTMQGVTEPLFICLLALKLLLESYARWPPLP